MIIRDPKKILNFLNGIGVDFKNRSVDDFLECSDEEIEKCHDRIQYAFPLHEESDHAHTYPVITPQIAEMVKKDSEAINNLKKLTDRMKKFYAIGEYYDKDRQRKWCKPSDHNLLRITRIIRSLRLFGLEKEAKDFYVHASMAADMFLPNNSITVKYWEKALARPIWETLK